MATGKKTQVGEGLPDPLMFSPDSQFLILSRKLKDEVQIYNIANNKNTVVKRTSFDEVIAMSTDGMAQVVFSKGAKLRALKTPYDTRTGKDIVTMEKVNLQRLGSGNPAMVFSPDGRTLLIKDEQLNIMLWDVATGKSRTLPGTAGLWFVFSPDNSLLLAECGIQGKIESSTAVKNPSVQLFDVASGKSIATLKIESSDVVFSPDSKQIAASYLFNISLWDAKTGKLIRSFDKTAKPTSSPKFTPDGKILISNGSDRTFGFWNVATGKQIGSLPREANLLAISPDGTTLATGARDGRVLLWNMPVFKDTK